MSSLRVRLAALEDAAVEAEVERIFDAVFAHLERHLEPELFSKVLRVLASEGRGGRS